MADILVVDDDRHVRKLFLEMLANAGHRVTEAEDVAHAVEAFKQDKPDLVITDLLMPVRNGFDLLREVKGISQYTPVIIVTASPSVTAAVECLKSGATDYLSKPVDYNELKRVVDEALRESLSPTGVPFLPAQREGLEVAHFRVKRTLGVGTYGVVYLAEDSTDGKLVALKILKSDVLTDDTKAFKTKSRFSREAHTISKLEHPNIVKIYEFSTDTTLHVPYIAMEFVDGQTLKDKHARLRNLSVEAKTRIIRQIVDALRAIHDAGLCHRDIKPHNIILNADNKVTVTDFGIVSEPDSELTNAADRLGSPAYMAPEAFWDARVEKSADFFSLGILAYFLYLDRRPFEASSLRALAKSVANDLPLEPRKIKAHFPEPLQNILAMTLRKDPAERYQDAADLLHDIDHFLDGECDDLVCERPENRRPIAKDWSA